MKQRECSAWVYVSLGIASAFMLAGVLGLLAFVLFGYTPPTMVALRLAMSFALGFSMLVLTATIGDVI